MSGQPDLLSNIETTLKAALEQDTQAADNSVSSDIRINTMRLMVQSVAQLLDLHKSSRPVIVTHIEEEQKKVDVTPNEFLNLIRHAAINIARDQLIADEMQRTLARYIIVYINKLPIKEQQAWVINPVMTDALKEIMRNLMRQKTKVG